MGFLVAALAMVGLMLRNPGAFASRDLACVFDFAGRVFCSPVSLLGVVQHPPHGSTAVLFFLRPGVAASVWARAAIGDEEKERMETQMRADDADERRSKPWIRERLGFVACAG